MAFVLRNGRQIEVITLNPPPAKPRRSFESNWRWVKVPRHWVSSLARSRSAATYRLALIILVEAFKRERHRGGEIVLSTKVTGMPRSTRAMAVRELVELGLITIRSEGRKATMVSKVRL
jgi:hypothetical protein